MKEKESVIYISAGLCLSVALLRMLAPALPFDWMTLVLVLAAAVLPALLQMHTKQLPAAPEPEETPFSFPEMEALRQLMQQQTWQRSEGDLPDALVALHEEKPFVAMCAARGILSMLVKQSAPSEADEAAVSLLISALDTAAEAGEAKIGGATVDALFTYAMRAMGCLK